jgi:GST-like protein
MTQPQVLADFSVTRKWPAQHPERIQLYSLPTPNGVKVSIALEEMQLPYEAHLVSFQTNDQLTPEFVGTFPTTRFPPSSTRKARAESRWRCSSRRPS